MRPTVMPLPGLMHNHCSWEPSIGLPRFYPWLDTTPSRTRSLSSLPLGFADGKPNHPVPAIFLGRFRCSLKNRLDSISIHPDTSFASARGSSPKFRVSIAVNFESVESFASLGRQFAGNLSRHLLDQVNQIQLHIGPFLPPDACDPHWQTYSTPSLQARNNTLCRFRFHRHWAGTSIPEHYP